MTSWHIHPGDVLSVLPTLPDQSVHCCITSPPYWGLRDYGVAGQIGLEPTYLEYIEKMVNVFREVHRILRDDGTLWLNLGDSYSTTANGPGLSTSKLQGSLAPHAQSRLAHARRSKGLSPGLKHKDLCGIPWRVALALQADGWYLRQDIIWSKPNPMPESVTDRCTKAHEYLFLLSKSPRYYFDQAAIKEPGSYFGSNSGVGFGHGYDAEPKTRAQSPVSGWDTSTGQGGHGTIHRETKGKIRGAKKVHKGFQKWDSIPVKEQCAGLRNKRSVWSVATFAFPEAHFATFPPDLIRPCVLAGCPPDGTILDPFNGSGTTGVVCMEEGRNYIGVELNPDYITMASKRITTAQPQWFGSVQA